MNITILIAVTEIKKKLWIEARETQVINLELHEYMLIIFGCRNTGVPYLDSS